MIAELIYSNIHKLTVERNQYTDTHGLYTVKFWEWGNNGWFTYGEPETADKNFLEEEYGIVV